MTPKPVPEREPDLKKLKVGMGSDPMTDSSMVEHSLYRASVDGGCGFESRSVNFTVWQTRDAHGKLT